jgi:hypothetical protein
VTDQQAVASAAASGWKFADRQSAANLPAYALQLRGGAGALVIFYTEDVHDGCLDGERRVNARCGQCSG